MKTTNTTITANTTYVGVDHQRLMNETFISNAATFGRIKASYLPLSELFVDATYQRKPQRKINQIASSWDDDKCGFLEVSYRGDKGKFAIIDGQNRFMAAKICGIDRLPCHILTGIPVKEEAFRFASQDANKTIVNTYDKFRAELCAGVPESMRLKEICDKYGIKIKNSAVSQTGHLRSITCAKKTLKTAGENGLFWIFNVIQESGWHNVKNAYSSVMMSALHNIYMAVGEDDYQVIKSNLVKYFEKTTPDHVVAQAMVAFYDSGKSSALTRFLYKFAVPEDSKHLLIKSEC